MKRFIAVAIMIVALSFVASPRTVVIQTVGNTVTLAWDANSEPDLAGYKVYRGTVSGTYGTPVTLPLSALPNPSAPQWTSPSLANGRYYFAVTAYNTAGLESGYSNEVSTTIATPPAPPRNLRTIIQQLLAWLFGKRIGG